MNFVFGNTKRDEKIPVGKININFRGMDEMPVPEAEQGEQE